MYLKKMQLYHFRNFDNTIIDFQDGVNIIVGPNNSGKYIRGKTLYFRKAMYSKLSYRWMIITLSIWELVHLTQIVPQKLTQMTQIKLAFLKMKN